MNNFDFSNILGQFNKFRWHDSKLVEVRLSRPNDENLYDVELMIRASSNDERSTQDDLFHLKFLDTRSIRFDLDLLGVALCGGDIGGATCHDDGAEIMRKYLGYLPSFDLPDDRLPVDELFACVIEMIHPGGDLLILSRDLVVGAVTE